MMKRRGTLLVEILPVLMLYAVAGTTLLSGVYAIRNGQKRVLDFSNRLAVTNDFLKTITRDVRAGMVAELHESTGREGEAILSIRAADGVTVYRAYENQVERSRDGDDSTPNKSWDPLQVGITVNDGGTTGTQTVVTVVVEWPRSNRYGPEPYRRFATTLRCIGELR
ncbi:MAG: hypothetical protein ACYTHJ_14050 [Planctomycetota bacterium]|jgi:hypothetical protein